MKHIRAAIPTEYFVRDTSRGLLYLARDLTLASCAWCFATNVDPFFQCLVTGELLAPIFCDALRWVAWCL
jgi:omega-6 fatty acid desaturase (delta-12 desaturase)